jgi:hypothetical protein
MKQGRPRNYALIRQFEKFLLGLEAPYALRVNAFHCRAPHNEFHLFCAGHGMYFVPFFYLSFTA